MTDVNRTDGSFELPKNPIVRQIVIVLAFVYGLLIKPVKDAAKHVSSRVYDGFAGWLFHLPVGLFASFWMASLAGWAIGWEEGESLLVWLPVSSFAFLLSLFLGYPAFILYIFRPVEEKCEAFVRLVGKAIDRYFGKLMRGIVDLVKDLPLSTRLWQSIETEGKKANWVAIVLVCVLVLAVLLGTVTWAVWVYDQVFALFPSDWSYAPTAVALFAAAVIVATATSVFWKLMNAGEAAFVAVVYSTAGVYALSPVTVALVGGYGAGAVWSAYAVEFIVACAYAFPGAILLAEGELAKRIGRWLVRVINQAYEEQDRDYRLFFSHVNNIFFSAVFAVVAFVLTGLYGFPDVVNLLAALAAFVIAYISNPKTFELNTTNILWGFLWALLVGIVVFLYGPLHGWLLYMSAILSGLTTIFVLFPLAYKGLRATTNPYIAHPTGRFLARSYDRIFEAARFIERKYREHVIVPCFADRSQESKFFGHLATLAIVGFGIYQALPLLDVGFGLPAILLAAALTVSTLFCYVLIGQVVFAAGNALVAAVIGVATFVVAGMYTYNVNEELWYWAIVVGFFAASVAGGVIFPLLYKAVRKIISPVTPVLEPPLTKFAEMCWKKFCLLGEKLWNLLKLLSRLWKVCARFLSAVWAAIWSVIGPAVKAFVSLAVALAAMVGQVWQQVKEVWTHRRG